MVSFVLISGLQVRFEQMDVEISHCDPVFGRCAAHLAPQRAWNIFRDASAVQRAILARCRYGFFGDDAAESRCVGILFRFHIFGRVSRNNLSLARCASSESFCGSQPPSSPRAGSVAFAARSVSGSRWV